VPFTFFVLRSLGEVGQTALLSVILKAIPLRQEHFFSPFVASCEEGHALGSNHSSYLKNPRSSASFDPATELAEVRQALVHTA
jgi:hypothetical protein